MYKKGYDKRWDTYKVKNIKFVNFNREHLCRKRFVEFVEKEGIKNIIEVGGGEFIEAQQIIAKNLVDNYSIVDVSKVFLELARSIDGINAFEGNMIGTPFSDKEFDLLYCCSVIEHSPDIQKTIKEMSRISNRFYITMYKWRNKTGDLKSYFKKKKGYYSTAFNVDSIIDLIESQGGDIKSLMIYDRHEGEGTFEDYRAENGDIDSNRNGKYLAIEGVWN